MKAMKKIPGGLMVVPLLLAVLVNTFFPALLEVGGPATALLQGGSQVLMGLFMVTCGASIKIKQAGLPLYKGSVLLLLKLVLGGVVGWLFGYAFGGAGILGITPFVLFCALPSNNTSLYAALCGEFGDDSDMGAISVLSLKSGPFGSMIAMGFFGAAHIPVGDFIGTLLPIVIGVVWSNLDEDFRSLCFAAQPLIVMFQAFAIGATSSLATLVSAGFSGVLLAVICLALGVVIQLVYNLLLKKKSPMGVALGTVAINAALTPSVIAAADPSFAPLVPAATAQCATASILTMLAAPYLVRFFNRRIQAGAASSCAEDGKNKKHEAA